MNYPYNDLSAKERRRILRKNQTDAEQKLWQILRNKQMLGLKFFRQYSVGPYILDFYCPKCRLAIEVDGSQHGETATREYDESRTKHLKKIDIQEIRFWNDEVLGNIEGVWEKTKEEIEKRLKGS